MNSKTHLFNYDLSMLKTYGFAALFVGGNVLLPQLAHLVPQGGLIFLPIYFFTLIAAYKYGMATGLLVAVLSPVVNHLLFGMPAMEVLPVLLMKSGLLAVTAAVGARYFKKVSLLALLAVVATYQVLGTAIEWAMVGDFYVAVQDFRLGLPGMVLQVAGGWLVLRALK